MGRNYTSKSYKVKMIYSRNYAEHDAKKADNNIYCCPTCNICWETIGKNQGYKKTAISYYDNFPTYGKKRKQCNRCKGEINGKHI